MNNRQTQADRDAARAGMRVGFLAAALACVPAAAPAGSLDTNALSRSFIGMAESVAGRAGFCAQDSAAMACVHGDDRFPMQSVVKLMVAIAVLDAVDRAELRLDDTVTVRKEDVSIGPQPLAKLVTAEGYQTTIGDLVARMVIDSDSTAYEILHRRIGGPAAVQAVLDRRQFGGIRSDRDEVDVNMELFGLRWRPEFTDKATFDRALAAVPPAKRRELFEAYLADPRDTATPKGMTELLAALSARRLLSPSSTAYLLDIMSRTKTFPDRLAAGLPPGWKIGHKTGTGPTWNGIVSVTNDVGLLTAPDGGQVAVAVFLSNAPEAGPRAAFIANVTRAIAQAYR